MAPRRSRGGAAGRLARVWVLAASASAAAPASYPGTSAATLTLSASLGDYAVLQRDAVSPPAVVWGFGSPGATVTGALDGAPLPPASVGADGVWRVPLPPTPGDRPGAPGHNFTFASSDGGSAAMSWVAFGDVWACGGQSNAAFTVSQAYGTYHPRDKQATGARLAAAVGDAVYGVPAQWRAPQVDPATVVFSQRASPGGAVTVTVTAPFVPGTVSPAGAAAVPAACPTAYGIPASACADFSVWFLPAPAPNWTYLGAGFLAAGNDVGGGNWTVQEAQAACDAVPSCVGFTWQGAGPTPPAPVPVLLKSALNFAADPAWQAWASDRDPRGERVAATGGVSPDGRTVTITATGGAGQAAAAAGYGWATWPVTPVVDAGTGLPLIPWYAPAPAAAGIGA
jgi:hypothetical protein